MRFRHTLFAKSILALLLFTTAAQAQGLNLALLDDNEYSASSVYPLSPGRDYGVNGAFDGDRKGYGWGNGGGWNDATRDQYPDWLAIKFKRPMSVKRAVVVGLQYSFEAPVEPQPGMGYCYSHGVEDFALQSSDDGVTWTTRAAVEENYECIREVVLPSEVRAQYWRLLVTEAGDHYSRVVEWEIYSH